MFVETTLTVAVAVFLAQTTPQADEPPTLEAPQIIHSNGAPGTTSPPSGYIDPRTGVGLGASGPIPVGLTQAFIRFNMPVYGCDGSDMGPASFTMTETGPNPPPHILDATYLSPGDRTYIIVRWDRPINLREWTTLRADVCNADGVHIVNGGNLGFMNEPDRVDFGFLVGNFDQNNVVNPLDLLKFKQYANGLASPVIDFLLIMDFTRDGVFDPFDLLAVRRMCSYVNSLYPCQGTFMLHVRP